VIKFVLIYASSSGMYSSQKNKAHHLGRCGDKWVTEDAEIDVPLPGEKNKQTNKLRGS
jgi:hypothetical protein